MIRVNPFTLKSDQYQVSPQFSLTKNMTSHSMKNLAFHKLTQMKDDATIPILTTSLTHFLTWELKYNLEF